MRREKEISGQIIGRGGEWGRGDKILKRTRAGQIRRWQSRMEMNEERPRGEGQMNAKRKR